MRILHTRLRGQVNKKSHLFKQIYFESMKCITESETERTNFSLNLDEYETMFRQPKLNFLITHCKKNKLVIMDLIPLVIFNPLKDCLAANYKI